MINEGYDYKASKRTSRQSVLHQISRYQPSNAVVPESVKRVSEVARLSFKGSALKPLHLNTVDEEEANNKNNKEEEKKKNKEAKALPASNSAAKYRTPNLDASHHGHQHQIRHHVHGQGTHSQQHESSLLQEDRVLNKPLADASTSQSNGNNERKCAPKRTASTP